MARKIIDIGVSPNDGTGDPIRQAFNKVNQNSAEVYGLLNNFATLTNVGVAWSENVDDEIISWINTNGLVIGKDEVRFLSVPQFYLPHIEPTQGPLGIWEPPSWTGNLLIWTGGAGSFGTVNGNELTIPRWFLVSKITPDKNTYSLGEIGSTTIEDAVNGSGPYDVTPGESTVFTVKRSGEDFAYLYIGNVNGEIGLGGVQTDASDYINLNEQIPDPIDPNDYTTIGKFNNSLYDTAETGFSTDLSNFTSLTGEFYFLRVQNEGDTVYFASKETNTEDFVGSRIYVSETGTKHDLGLPTVTQNGYHFWDLGVMPITINPSSGDWDFQVWFDPDTDDLDRVLHKGNVSDQDIILRGAKEVVLEQVAGEPLARMFQQGTAASGFEATFRNGLGAITAQAIFNAIGIVATGLGTYKFPDKQGSTTEFFAMLSDLVDFANDNDVLHNTAEEKVALKDDTARDIFIGKEFDEGTSAYTSTAQLVTSGYTLFNGYVQGSEIIMRNTGTYTRYEKMSDDDNDWMFFTNANGWQPLPLV